jgi:hypothetical protein
MANSEKLVRAVELSREIQQSLQWWASLDEADKFIEFNNFNRQRKLDKQPVYTYWTLNASSFAIRNLWVQRGSPRL